MNTLNKRIWILGAADPEMDAIETLLAGEQVVYATAGGQRVHQHNAYEADGTSAPLTPNSTVVFVECDCDCDCDETCALCQSDHISVDHHRPGDPGYGRPPAEFLSASSLGQVYRLLRGGGEWQYQAASDEVTEMWILAHDEYGDIPNLVNTRESELQFLGIAAVDHCRDAAYRGECPGVEPDALMRWRIATRANVPEP